MENLQRHNAVQTEITGVSGSRLIWRSPVSNHLCALTDAEFVAQYSRVVSNGFFQDKSRLSPERQVAVAERYGGAGLGTNGGGARVVNFDGVQLKGVGANALVGADALTSHSYGGLDAQAAVKELIYSSLISHISPVGSQKIYGLILLDRTSAKYGDQSTWSTILVREPCLRPAHFLSCTDFRVLPQYKHLIYSDSYRLRSIYQDIHNSMGPSNFYLFIERFLEACADQLSFCRMARFSHNVLTSSNLTIDGRLLDTSVSTFVHAGTNFGQITDFYREPAVPLQIVGEMFYLLEKYTHSTGPLDHFVGLYQRSFERYLQLNLGYVFGLARATALRAAYNRSWVDFATLVASYIVSGSGEKSYKLPNIHMRDGLNEDLSVSLYAVLHQLPLRQQNRRLETFKATLEQAVSDLYPYFSDQFADRRQFFLVLFIQTLKRAHLPSYFYLTYISRAVDDAVATGVLANVTNTIHKSLGVIPWIFEEVSETACTLYQSDSVKISFNVARSTFDLHEDGMETYSTTHPQEFFRSLGQSSLNLKISHYNFKPFLMQLGAFLYADPNATFRGVRNVFS